MKKKFYFLVLLVIACLAVIGCSKNTFTPLAVEIAEDGTMTFSNGISINEPGVVVPVAVNEEDVVENRHQFTSVYVSKTEDESFNYLAIQMSAIGIGESFVGKKLSDMEFQKLSKGFVDSLMVQIQHEFPKAVVIGPTMTKEEIKTKKGENIQSATFQFSMQEERLTYPVFVRLFVGKDHVVAVLAMDDVKNNLRRAQSILDKITY